MIRLFLELPYVSLFIIIAIGIAVGRISIKGISLGMSAIILVALVFGHFGFSVPKIFQEVGLMLFIYSIGIQAGPGFLNSFKSQGKQLVIIALVALVSAAGTVVGLSYIAGVEFDMAAGLFTGAITSAPGLAVAIESSKTAAASIGYGISYPLGILGVILFAKFSPNIFKINLKKEEDDYKESIHKGFPEVFGRYFRVENKNIFNKTIGQLKIRTMTGANVSRILSKDVASIPSSDTVLLKGDVIKAVGSDEVLEKVKLLIGPETEEEINLSSKYVVRKILVSNKEVMNKSLGELAIFEKYHTTAARIRRAGIDLTPNKHTRIKLGDKITVASTTDQIDDVCRLFGDNSKSLREFDVLPIAITILIGVVIGRLSFPLGGMNMSLGITGGVLVASIFLSNVGKTGKIVWNISGTVNQFLRNLGLMFFLAAVGTKAGSTFVDTFQNYGISLILIGAATTFIPMVLCVLIARYVLKMNFLTVMGGLTGSMTSTPALSAIESMSETDAAQSAYAAVYPVALVIMIALSQLIVSLAFI